MPNQKRPDVSVENIVPMCSVWEVIRVNIKISAEENLVYFELKKHGYTTNAHNY
jgi:hypothetical protein